MTSLSTMLGALPIALALGAGASNRISMGIAVIGGMLFSTLLSLYVIPTLYVVFTKNRPAAKLNGEAPLNHSMHNRER